MVKLKASEHKNVESVIRYYLLFLPPKHVNSILNVGGGITDQYMGVLKRRCVGRYANLDLRKSRKVDFVCDVTKGTPFVDDEWEWGWCSEVIEHVSKRKQKKFVDEVVRICKNIVFTFPMPEHPSFKDDPGHTKVIVNFSKYQDKFNIEKKVTKSGRCIVTLRNKKQSIHEHSVDDWL